ncbi:MAG TPA: GNAT family N-acetyltransferase [Gemmatimonadaceae bacterium]
MNDQLVEEVRDGLVLTTDRARIKVDQVLSMLHASHWGAALTRPVLERAIAESLCFSVLDHTNDGRQLGFARAVTDLATYAYLTDVIVAEDARGRGIGSWMVEAIVGHPDLQGLRRIALLTRNAQRLYERFGFTTEPPPSVYMELRTRR